MWSKLSSILCLPPPPPNKISHLYIPVIMCGSRKYPYSPHRRDWKFRGGGGVSKTQKFKAMYGAKLEFPEEVIGQIPSVGGGGGGGGGVWIFSGTTQYEFH